MPLGWGGMARSFLIAVAIAAMNQCAEPMADSLYSGVFCPNVK